MKILKFTSIIVTSILLVFILLGFIAPKDFSMERSIVINASPEEVYQNMSDFKKFYEWSPWSKSDPNSKVEFSGDPNTLGHKYSWKGNKDVGEGDMSITKLENETIIGYHLNFIEPFASQADGLLIAESENGATKASWSFNSHFGFIESVFMMFMNMEKMLGADFENGLKNLKQISEK